MITVDAVGLALRVSSPRLVEQQGSWFLLLTQTVLICSTQTQALDPESFGPTPLPAPLTESPGRLRKASINSVGFRAAVPAELRHKRLRGRAAQLFSHLCTQGHGIPASMLCTECHSGEQDSHISHLSAPHLSQGRCSTHPSFLSPFGEALGQRLPFLVDT